MHASARHVAFPRTAKLTLRLALVAAVSFIAPDVAAQDIQVGEGSYHVGSRTGPENTSGERVSPLMIDGFTGPVPTNDWWTSLIWNRNGNAYSAPMYAHPLALEADGSGLSVRYPDRVTTAPTWYFHDIVKDLHVGIDGLAATETRGAPVGDFAVRARWDDGTRVLEAVFGHGLPYVYFTASGGNARVEFGATVTVWSNTGGVAGVTVNGRHYGLFAPTGSSWTGSNVLQNTLDGKGYFSVAVLTTASAAELAYFRRHAYAFVSDTRVEPSVDIARSLVETVYTATTELRDSGAGLANAALLALYRHQWLHSGTPVTGRTYASPRGTMKLVDTGSFRTTLTFGGVLPSLPSAGTVTADPILRGYVDDVFKESNLIPGGDTYWAGKGLGRLALLVPLAYESGHIVAAIRFTTALKSRLQLWLSAATDPRLEYNPEWGALIGYPESFATGKELNDHHFHYGYFLQAAATVAQYDPAWAEPGRWGGMVDLLVRDAASWRRDDDLFPYLRNFDPYAGHSWASGHGWFADGNNQESSSEAMNFAAGMIRWGLATGNDAMRDMGIYLFATELSAIEQYWFDVDDVVFPAGFGQTALGMVWGNKGDYSTWFGSNPEFIHGINFLPVTGGSLYLGRHPDYVRRNWENLLAKKGREPSLWQDIFWEFLSFADPQGALDRFNADPGYAEEDGESRAHTYHWLTNMLKLGRVDTGITADIPTYGVFLNGTSRTYAAFNPGASARTVAFSDGTSLDVEPRKMATFVAATNVGSERPAESGLTLSNVFPNPFTGVATISLTVDRSQDVRVRLVDLLGREVGILHDGMVPAGGTLPIRVSGHGLAPGVYMVEARGNTFTKSVRVVRAGS